MKIILLAASLCCLIPPFTPIGVCGIIAYFLYSLLEALGSKTSDIMSDSIENGNNGLGTVWLIITFLIMIGGGIAIGGSFLIVASSYRP